MSENENKKRLMAIGSRVKLEREKMGLTQEQFAEKFGYPRSTISKLEAGLRDFKSTEILTLAEQLNVSCDYLLGRTMVTAADEVVQEATTRYGLSERAFEWLGYCNYFNHNKVANDAGAGMPTRAKKSVAMLNYLISFTQLEIAMAEAEITCDEFDGDMPFPLVAMWILNLLHEYCFEKFVDIELPGTEKYLTADDMRQVNVLRINSLFETLRKHLQTGGVTNGKHNQA